MFYILSKRLYPEKIGFWVWVLSWVLYQNPKPKPKTQQFLYPNPKPNNFYTQTQNPTIFIPKPKTQQFL
jgi:hypothetical protein